jgi:hypothetical protein
LSIVAALSGVVVLLGYFLPNGPLTSPRTLLLDWAIILAAVALLVGVVNLFKVHLGKLKQAQRGRYYSLVIVIVLPLTLMVVGFMGPTSAQATWIYRSLPPRQPGFIVRCSSL